MDIVQILVEKLNHSLDVTEKSKLQSPLHISCQYGQFDIMIYLTERGCTRTLRDIEGKEPLDYALEDKIMHYLCNHLKTSTSEATNRIIIYYMLRITFNTETVSCHFDWKTYSGVNSIVKIMCGYCNKLLIPVPTQMDHGIINVYMLTKINNHKDLIPLATCHTKSCVSSVPSIVIMEYLRHNTLDPTELVVSDSYDWKTADGDTLLQLVCQSQSCVLRISSTVMLMWLTNTNCNLKQLIVPNYKTADGDTLLQLVCQSESCVSRISSTVMLMWLTNTKCNLKQLIVPSYKTADGDTLLQLVCQSQSCVSRISSTVIKFWLKRTNVELLLPGLYWKTADGVTMINIVCQLESHPLEKVFSDDLIDVVITPHREAVDHINWRSLQVSYRSELYVSHITSKSMLKWLQNTSLQLDKILVPHWKTADGDTLLQLVCQSQSCVLRISSTVMLMWLTNTNCNLKQLIVPNYKTADGDTLLQLVCQSESCVSRISSTVMLMWLTNTKCNLKQLIVPSYKTADGDTLLQLVCQSQSCVSRMSSTMIKFWLKSTNVELLLPRLDWKTADGVTLLELVCQSEYLLSHLTSHVILECLNNSDIYLDEDILPSWKTAEGDTMFKLICTSQISLSHISSLLLLKWMKNGDETSLDVLKSVNPDWKTADGDTILHLLCKSEIDEIKVIQLLKYYLKEDILKSNPNIRDRGGNVAIHLACKTNKPAVVKFLLKQCKCNPSCKNSSNELPIELTTNIDAISYLMEHGATMSPELILKFVAIKDIPNEQLAQLIWNPDASDSEGNTALHLACLFRKPDIVNFLLSQANCDPNVKNNKKEVPLQMTTNLDIVKDLIRYGAQTSIMYESHESALGTNEPIKPPVKIFVVGNPSVGKSTLTEALKKKLNLVARWFTSGKVSGVDKKTVGIIPHKFDSEIFGQVTVYDFAGHREFYSGHAALLKAAIQSNPPIFIIVVNLCNEVNDLIRNILYWISFLENQCTLVSCKPHLIIVGSHADTLKSEGESPQEKVNALVSLLNPNYFINLKFMGFIPMDCQLHESTGMNDLRPLLVKSCSELRIQEPIAFNAHCFLVYLLETFKDIPAVTLGTVHEEIEKSHREGVLEFLPKNIGALYKICIELNERGHILFLKDRINVESSYVVIEEKSLLSEVSGTVFASEDFKQYKHLATNTGVVSRTKIAECFPGKDPKILIGLLTHLEFCYEISTADQTLFKVISENYSPDFDERYYLFSGLISSEAKKSVWKTKSDFDYSFGWILRCTKPEQFLSSRFLQVLLLRLAFSFAFELRSSSQGEDPNINLAIHRKCSLWKNGIFWGTHFGMDTLVEVIDNKLVVVMARFKASHVVKCVAHRSQIIHTVLECAKEFCPRISTVESFIETSSSPLEYPFELTSETCLCTIKDLSEALVINCENPSVVSSESAKSISAVSFFSFEPYAEIEATILKQLWDKVNENEVVPDIFISRLIKKVSIQNLQFMIKLFNKEADIPSRSTKDDLYQEILNWRDTSDTEPKTYSQLRKKFDQHSVFAGRNLLVSMVYIRLILVSIYLESMSLHSMTYLY